MEQSSGESTHTQSNQKSSGENTQTQGNLSDSLSEDELIVIEALLAFSTQVEFGNREKPEEGKGDVYLAAESESVRPLVLVWGCKRRRSANGWRSEPSSPPRRPHSPSPPPPPPPPEPEIGGEKVHKVEVEASSPATPLSYPPSEPDDKLKRKIHKSSNKRTREELLNAVDELVQCRGSLRKALEDVRSYYGHVLALNSALKAMKEELSSNGHAKPHMEITTNTSSIVVESSRSSLRPCSSAAAQIHDLPQSQYVVQEQLCIVNQTAANGSSRSQQSQNFHHSTGRLSLSPLLSSGPILGVVNQGAPLRLPDLNASAEESNLFGVDPLQPLDLSRDAEKKAKAAEARRLRMVRIKDVRQRSSAAVVTDNMAPLRSR